MISTKHLPSHPQLLWFSLAVGFTKHVQHQIALGPEEETHWARIYELPEAEAPGRVDGC